MVVRGKCNGAKHITEAMGFVERQISRGAFRERGSGTGRSRGAIGSENAGMSSEKHVRTMFVENPRFPTSSQSASG